MLELRRAEEIDLNSIKELLKIVWLNTYIELIPEYIIEEVTNNWHSLENLKKQILSDKYVFLVAELNSEIVGIITMSFKDRIAYLSRLYIHPNYQRKGLGESLIDKIVSEYTPDEIILEVEEDNLKAINFYNKQGFKIQGTNSFFIKDFELKNLIMNLKLHQE